MAIECLEPATFRAEPETRLAHEVSGILDEVDR